MEYPCNLGSYINLSRKEIQELCKNNNLPANGSTSQLAKSLASFFKKKKVFSSPLKVSSSGRMEAAAYNSCLPNTEPEVVTPLSEEAVRGIYEKSIISLESDTHKVPPIIEEDVSGDMQHCQTRDQLGNNHFMDHQTLDTACDACVIDVRACKFNYESTNVLDWSLQTDIHNWSVCQHGHMCVKSSVAVDVQPPTVGSQLDHWCYHGSFKNESQKSQNPRSYGQGLLVNRIRENEAHLLTSGGPRLLESPIEVGYASSYERYSKSAPSFDFFMMSDDGINLYVDLNSSTSEWIKKLKDEVCINQKVEHQSLGSLTDLTKGFLDVNVQMKSLQSKSTASNLQKDVDKGSGFTNSSFGSVFSGTCQEVYPSDATLASSGSSIITSSSNPVDIYNHVLSSCIANNNFHNLTTIDNTSTHQEENILHQDSRDNPFRVDRSNNGHEGAEVSIACNATSTICEKNNTQKSNVSLNNVKDSDVSLNNVKDSDVSLNNVKDSDVSLNNVKDSDVSTTETYMSLSSISSLEKELRCEKSSSSCKLGEQSNLNSAVHPCQHWSNRLEDSVPKDSNSSAGENLRKNGAVLEKERSECSKFQNFGDKNSKRSCNTEFDEVILNNVRHHSDRKKRNLGCTMSSTKESVSDAIIPPRRSSRLLSK
ncbi:hypothetical protein KSP39_PZI014039 [Platanthera zijinensis]|uniref:Uncharacterized protein n=1 Tax=Platanthera zijinensis TaxID=2320716 RepID=A0AAP0G3Z5_9ASPA